MSWPQPLPPEETPWRKTVPEDLVPGRQPLPRVTLRSARVNLALFTLTVASVILVGGNTAVWLPNGSAVEEWQWGAAFRMVGAIFPILLAHEFGHYFAARLHAVDASLPYFIPFPFSLVGTLGAFIRIRAPIPHRKALFDIGVAGPLAGFAVCLPVLALGVLEGRWVPLSTEANGLSLGEPLLFHWAVEWLRGPAPENSQLFIGPVGMAAWFGLLVTALNLMPVGQLDGGHVTYALAPRHAIHVSRAGLLLCLALLYHRPSWLAWAVLLLLLGRRPHPPTFDDGAPIGRTRMGVGLLALAVFALCFTPDTIVISWSDVARAAREALAALTSH